MIEKSGYFSVPSQTERLDERHEQNFLDVDLDGMNIVVEPGVYQTSGDTLLMMECVKIGADQNFLEIGCGSGAVSVAIAKRALSGVGVDINEKAVANAKRNAEVHGIKNLEFFTSNVFENVSGKFDVIICNPPYNNHDVSDNVDRMFWDPNDEMKNSFFKNVGEYLKLDGKIYFGWADFSDIDTELPFRLAEKYGFKVLEIYKKPHKEVFSFYVIEFIRKF